MDYSIYFIPTPIGNLEDITIRAINILKKVDIIACEDTRESKKLLDYYDIDKPLTSYHKFNEISKGKDIIENVKTGKTYGIITDQGMPGISDPGHILIKKCIEEEISYTILPGASSLITALVGSGLDNNKFSYYGFIPKKNSDKKDLYNKLEIEENTSIIFDTPHNLENTISDFKEIFPERKLCIARELTKKFEEYLLYDINKINIADITLKGEFVLILSGKVITNNESLEDYKDEIKLLLEEGKKTKDISKIIKDKSSFSKNEIYNYIISLQKN
ncbi:MAG: 16S rRNA (cytidine(1402)-2'-O)-methyltransferase [Anaerococcus sp.]|uniref:16S rRNA (cytidine(1402)-2'-O)-methyltransferase n=1 Tax=Anaerococcus sp. TaxID=1872515 RepID=UPI00290255A8|nr:16S rRNA (cytidine(1402)-2'-O)-methyltransferase [Anaerococcus sp.]MDU2565776.1 16S rRNA (cytidine(1402)-2'-O)-methyltransferase [Anaerococcus sp.]